MTGYDLFAILVLAISALAGWFRGGVREVVSLFSFLIAAIVALLALPFTGPLGREVIDPDWIGTTLAVVVAFLIVYAAIRLIGAGLSRSIRENGALGGIDRFAGLFIGALRAIVLIGVIHLVFYAITPPERMPGWFRDAAVHPAGATVARGIQMILPGIGRAADATTAVVGDAVQRGAADQPQSDDTSAPPQLET